MHCETSPFLRNARWLMFSSPGEEQSVAEMRAARILAGTLPISERSVMGRMSETSGGPSMGPFGTMTTRPSVMCAVIRPSLKDSDVNFAMRHANGITSAESWGLPGPRSSATRSFRRSIDTPSGPALLPPSQPLIAVTTSSGGTVAVRCAKAAFAPATLFVGPYQ